MPSPSPSDKSGWRGGKTQPWRGAPGGPKGWAKKKDREYEHAVWRHRLRLVVSLLVLVGLVGALVYYLIPSWRRTPFVCVAVTDYPAPIPPNGWAVEDVERFADMDQDILTQTPFRFGPADRRLDGLRAALKEAVPGGPDKDLILVYLSMHGVVDGRNEPCLLPPGASAAMPGDWLRVADLLDCLKQRPGVKKLLVLDANRMDVDFSLGLLANGFADALKELVEKHNDPDLMVLNSAGPGQVGWAAPELGGSVFGYCVWRGLKGKADANEDDQVTVRELDAYLKVNVADWTTAHRDDVQTPMLLMPSGMDDHPLVYTQRPEVAEPDSAIADLREQIGPLWRSHDELARTAEPLRLNPLKWEQFQATLLRVEQLAQAGPSYAQEYGKAKEDAAALAFELKTPPAIPGLVAHSLPMAGRLRPTDPAATAAARRALVAWMEPPVEAAPPETPAAGGATNGASPPSPPGAAANADAEKPPTGTPPAAPAAGGGPPPSELPAGSAETRTFDRQAAAEAAWNWAIEETASQGDLTKALAFVAKTDSGHESQSAELLFAWMVDTYLDPALWQHEGATGPVKTALRIRGLAETAASPADERTQYAIRAAADQADQHRRQAEDLLFVGGAAQLTEAAGLWQQAEGDAATLASYAGVMRRTDDLAEAFRTRDEAWAKTPHLARWILSRLQAAHTPDGTLAASLVPLIRATRELAEQLDAPTAPGQVPPDLKAPVDAVRTPLDALLEQFNNAVELEPAAADAAKLRRIVTVLATPLVTGESRIRLWDDYAKIARSIPSEFAAENSEGAANGESAAESRPATATEPSAYLDFLDQGEWGEHPVLSILRLADRDVAATDVPGPLESWTAAQLAAEGDTIRHLLYGNPRADQAADPSADPAVPAGVFAKAAAWLKASQDSIRATDSPAVARAGRARADQLTRASAALLAAEPWPDPQPDPTGDLRRFDLHCLMLWQADRAIEDFWGPTLTDPRPFFELAGGDYLRSAAMLCPASGIHAAAAQRLARATAAVAHVPQPTVPPRPFDERDEVIDHGATIALGEDLPEGRAAFFLREGPDTERAFPLLRDGNPVDRLAVAVAGVTDESVHFRILTRNLKSATGLEAVALYRGHVRQSPCRFPPDEGWDVEYVPLRSFAPKITVEGAKREERSVVFILDCSKSMAQKVGGDEGAAARINVARDVLKDILSDTIRRDPSLHVGVMIYSRRAEWGRDAKGDVVAIQRTSTPVHPCADVEWLFRPGVITDRDRETIFEQLDESKPGGSTPLYLAILMAMPKAPFDDKSCHIVVITDGMNDQLSDLPMPATIDNIKTQQNLGNVESGLKENPNVRLDVVGFDLSPDKMSATDQSSYQAFRKFLGDRFFDAPNAEKLKNAILTALSPPKVTARSLPDEKTAAEPVLLGATLLVDERADRYAVRIEDPERPLETEVELEGNEWLLLHVGEDRASLVYEHSLAPGDARGEPILVAAPVGGDATGPFRLQAHRPHREDATVVTFDMSLWKDDDREFARRPTQVWMEVTPLKGRVATDFVRVFYDRDFKADYPVPRLTSVAQNWPPDADAAQIQFWLKYDDASDTVERPLAQLLPGDAGAAVEVAGAAFAARITPPEQPNDPCEVEIKETHAADGPWRYVKVDMAPTPEKVTRHFSPQTRTIRHTFTYRGVGPDQVKYYSVRFTAEEWLKERAMSLPTPVVVDVPAPGQ